MEEVWRDIPGYEKLYQVSNIGNVRSLNYKGSRETKNLKHSVSGNGYPMVAIKGKKYTVHSLVASAFFGPIPKGMVVDHIDGDKCNNNLNNLEIVTYSENNLRAYKLGLRTPMFGDNNPNKGKHFSVEHRKKISVSLLGHEVSKQTRIKMSEARKGKPISKETRIKLSKAMTGRTRTEEHRKKLSISRSRPVIQYDKEGNVLKRYYGLSEAARKTGNYVTNISKCCMGKIKTCGGYVWRYEDEVNGVG